MNCNGLRNTLLIEEIPIILAGINADHAAKSMQCALVGKHHMEVLNFQSLADIYLVKHKRFLPDVMSCCSTTSDAWHFVLCNKNLQIFRIRRDLIFLRISLIKLCTKTEKVHPPYVPLAGAIWQDFDFRRSGGV